MAELDAGPPFHESRDFSAGASAATGPRDPSRGGPNPSGPHLPHVDPGSGGDGLRHEASPVLTSSGQGPDLDIRCFPCSCRFLTNA